MTQDRRRFVVDRQAAKLKQNKQNRVYIPKKLSVMDNVSIREATACPDHYKATQLYIISSSLSWTSSSSAEEEAKRNGQSYT
jgi:hypothetical protein